MTVKSYKNVHHGDELQSVVGRAKKPFPFDTIH